MIDNFILKPTIVHTVGEVNTSEGYVNLYPNPVADRLHIQLAKTDHFHIIQKLMIYSSEGQLVKQFANIPTKFFMDVSDLPKGTYEVVVTTNLKTEVHKIVII